MAKLDKYEQWKQDGELDEKLGVMTSLSMQGVSLKEIAKSLDVGERTLMRMKKQQQAVRAALKKGRQLVVVNLQKALMSRVASGDTVAIIYALKVYGGEFFQDQKEIIELKRREVENMAARNALEREKFEKSGGIDREAILEAAFSMSHLFDPNVPERSIEDFED